MSRIGCPREPEALAAHRRGKLEAALAAHVRSCPHCGPSVAADRALAALRAAGDAGPFPSAAALRLEAELRREERRLARRACLLIGLHAGALAISLALFAAVRLLESVPDSPPSLLGSTGSVCAIVAVVICLWNLFRTADESPLLS